ncbi:hypothetical protein RDI58_007206 [Solanum bulbocastanum]|uniref:Uncharacterized protein n=1 Tax=Solanum bulbocastanum TaxID=147425 RepID=A0AAN8YLW9_SOLBU
MDIQLEELQKVLTRTEKEIKMWTSKKKKTSSLIEDHQKRLSENQETITKHEDEIHAIEKIILLSESEIKELAKLKEDAETSRHQILSHKPFPESFILHKDILFHFFFLFYCVLYLSFFFFETLL